MSGTSRSEQPDERERPVVETEAGRVRGFWRGDCATFLGVPYAQPPVGGRRFREPIPHEAWDGVRDAVVQGATPLRYTDDSTIIPEPHVKGASTLNANIFTPSPGPEAALPVLVYIHGGAYISGSIASPWYDGRSFARDGVVTVTLSYRLGFDGFGWIEDAPSNRGVRDWLAGLEWVSRNIRAFGGDPDRVTIAGQSAGGGAVLTLLGMPRAQHLFRAGWVISAPVSTLRQEEAERLGRGAAALAHVEPTVAGWSALTEGQVRKAAADLVHPHRTLASARAFLTSGLPLGPVADGDLVPDTTIRMLAAGTGADKPLVIGTTDDEFSGVVEPFAPWLRRLPPSLVLALLGLTRKRRKAYLEANAELLAARGVDGLTGRLTTDALFRRNVVRVARARSHTGAGGLTWAYRFAWLSPMTRASGHCLDVPFFFDVLDAEGVARVAGPAPSQRLARAVHGSAVAFVRGDEVPWAPASDLLLAHTFDQPAPRERETTDAYAGARPLA